MSSSEGAMSAAEVMALLPHRYPFLLIDGVVSLRPGEAIEAYKNVSVNEPFFQGHFPGRPVMPGVLIIEAMAQAGGILSYLTGRSRGEDTIYYLGAVDEARFRRAVVPGDRLDINVTVTSVRRGMWFYDCVAMVDGERAVSAKITCAPGNAS